MFICMHKCKWKATLYKIRRSLLDHYSNSAKICVSSSTNDAHVAHMTRKDVIQWTLEINSEFSYNNRFGRNVFIVHIFSKRIVIYLNEKNTIRTSEGVAQQKAYFSRYFLEFQIIHATKESC
ncbi:hypothetical protein Bhyg_12351 [Pseudolycoriella hygida]|uniref:Uncharacterized protein n=1 Tax=Pseudolycoriella hygida TaxID=35572 RepID=A0A9Q0MYD7_9DIPT|nr:hypothetical protein Bhyg_12351 [Pseudolycoriella hygida]